MKKINYKSDFDFTLRLKDCEGKEIPFPDCDWDAVFWTSSKANAYTASCKGGQCVNCFKEESGGIHFVFDNHRMGKGTLQWEPHFEFPNGIYPDGIQDRFSKEPLGIELVDGAGDCPTTEEIEVIAPTIKGDPLTYDDLTEEQKAELQRPATEAAESVSKLEEEVSRAEALRKDAEQTREANEQSRISAEKGRVSDENSRKSNETARQGNEATRTANEVEREANEESRVSAEQSRAEEFAAWQGEIDSKADRSELSNVFAEEPLTPENFPDISTYTREELKKDLFVDMWNEAWGEYGKYDPANAPDAEHPFMGNKIWMTYEEAIRVMHNSVIYAPTCAGLYMHKYPRCRTLLPTIMFGANEDCSNMYGYCATEEALRIKSGYGDVSTFSNAAGLFYQCVRLKEVYGILDFNKITSKVSPATECTVLEGIYIKRLKSDLDMQSCPKWRLDCIKYLIQNAINTSAITVTVHPDVYAKLTDETNTEWHALLALAAEKNITIATT